DLRPPYSHLRAGVHRLPRGVSIGVSGGTLLHHTCATIQLTICRERRRPILRRCHPARPNWLDHLDGTTARVRLDRKTKLISLLGCSARYFLNQHVLSPAALCEWVCYTLVPEDK